MLLFVFCITAILIFVAFNVDLGQARFSKRSEQQLADLASLSAGRQMAGYGTTSAGNAVARPRDACAAAMASIQTNEPEFSPTSSAVGTACAALPATTAACTSSTLPINASVSDGPYVVTVRWPIPDSEIADAVFLGTGTNDGTDQCTRLRIAVQRTDDTSFAGVMGVNDLTTSQSAVIRATIDPDQSVVPSFLILERSRCGALTNSASGSGSFGIQVRGIPSSDQPGTIHVDSTADLASGSDKCSGNAANSVAVYGTTLSSGDPSIFLHPAPMSGELGLLYAVAGNDGSCGMGSDATCPAAKSVPDGINLAPQTAGVISRAPLDEEFNEPTANPAITDLHARARTALDTTVTSDTIGDGWRRLDCALDPLDATDTDITNWYVRCDTYGGGSAPIDNRATAFGVTPGRIVFDGGLNVPGGSTLSFSTTVAGDIAEVSVKRKVSAEGSLQFGTGIQRIYIGGADTASTASASPIAVGNNGDIRIRTNSLATFNSVTNEVDTVCPTGAEPGQAEFVVFGDDAAFTSSGALAMCNTTVYLAGNFRSLPYTKQIKTYGGDCTAELPCPKLVSNAADAGYFVLQGPGSSDKYVDWTAPNTTSGPPPSPRGLEDLLFWSESSGKSEVKSGAEVLTQGVFVGPSMNVEFRSPALGSPRNAQFIARRLDLKQGTLNMQPSPNDSTPIFIPGSFTIIR